MSNATKVVVWDVETTRLIDRQRGSSAIEQMEISVACAIVFDVEDLRGKPHEVLARSESRVYWHEDVFPRSRERLDKLAELLAECRMHVAFNGLKFDMKVMRQHFATTDRYDAAMRNLYDPFDDLSRSIGSFSLASLLQANNIDGKSGKGADAPGLWASKEYEKLEEYCAIDVDRLAQLVLKPSIRIPGFSCRAPFGTLGTLIEDINATEPPLVVEALEPPEPPEAS